MLNSQYISDILRIGGYTLFISWIFEIISYFFPLGFGEPVWEFDAMGKIVNAGGTVLVALALIFLGSGEVNLRLEKNIIKGLSWFCLGLAILHFAMLPLGLGNAWRIKNRLDVEVGLIVSQRMENLRKLEIQIKETKSDKELADLFNTLVPPDKRSAEFKNADTQEIKTKMLAEINKSAPRFKAEAEATKIKPLQLLVKDAVKTNFGTIIFSVAFMYFWRFSRRLDFQFGSDRHESYSRHEHNEVEDNEDEN